MLSIAFFSVTTLYAACKVADAIGLTELIIGDNVTFLEALCMAVPGSTKSKIFLSKAGSKYAQALISGDRAV